MLPLIGIITVLYNSEEVLTDFFETLEIQSYKNFILFIVDNNSIDNSLSLAKKLSCNVSFKTVIIPEKTNWGVAKGNNIGIKRAIDENCEYLILSNNDTVLLPDTIMNLYRGMVEEEASIVVPKIFFNNSDLIWYAGGYFSKLTGWTKHYSFGRKDIGKYDRRRIFNYAPTCFMLLEKDIFNRIGLFDENYFVYFDDSDFVLRAKKGNEKMVYIPESILYHKDSVSTGGGLSNFGLKYTYRNLVYFSLKNYNSFICSLIFTYHLAHFLLRKTFSLNRQKRKIVLNSYLEGYNLYKQVQNGN